MPRLSNRFGQSSLSENVTCDRQQHHSRNPKQSLSGGWMEDTPELRPTLQAPKTVCRTTGCQYGTTHLARCGSVSGIEFDPTDSLLHCTYDTIHCNIIIWGTNLVEVDLQWYKQCVKTGMNESLSRTARAGTRTPGCNGWKF